MKTKVVKLTPYIEKEILIAKLNEGMTREEKQTKVEKKCMMCGTPTTNKSGFCNQYLGSIFDCKSMWFEEYSTKPTKKELCAKWRDAK